jgi:gliding motility-associated lipoprotein GldB
MCRFLILVFSSVLYSCTFISEDRPDISDIKIDLEVKRLEQTMFALSDKESVKEFLDDHPALSQHFFQIDQYPHDSILVNSLFKLINDPYIDTLYNETQEAFGDLTEIEDQFTQAFRFLKFYYPEFKVPEIQTIITGFGRDLFVSDSIIIIGLDFYIGKNASYRPLDLPQYILSRYEKEYIVPSCILLMSRKYNYQDPKDNTMLADMIYYGKSYYFADQILPDTPDSVLIGYSAEELSDVYENQEVIWAHFIENQLLYEKSHFIKKKYIDERPKTLEIGNKAPGRIGVWLGWEIVRRFMEENDQLKLPQLMEIDDAQRIFTQSKYKPSLP